MKRIVHLLCSSVRPRVAQHLHPRIASMDYRLLISSLPGQRARRHHFAKLNYHEAIQRLKSAPTTVEELISQIGHTVCRRILTLQSPNAFLVLVTAWHTFNLCLIVHNLWVVVVGFPAHLSFLATTAAASVASWIFGNATYGIQTAAYGIQAGVESIQYLSLAITSYAFSFAIFEGNLRVPYGIHFYKVCHSVG